MARTYKKGGTGKRNYQSYTEATLLECLDAVKSGKMSERLAAKTFKVPRSTLQNRIHGKHGKSVGRSLVFTDEEEQLFETRVALMCDWGFPIDFQDLRILISSYLRKKNRIVKRFASNVPGDDWIRGFIKRRKLTNRLTSNIKRKRAEITKESLERYFTNIKTELEGVPAANVWNYDETNLTDDPGRKKAIMRRGTKYPERVINHSKVGFSIMFCGNAEGKMLEPYTVYKAKNMYPAWMEGGPLNARYGYSDSGWFEERSFEDWFFQLALPILRKQDGKKVLVGDNLSSHMSERVIEACKLHDIAFICLYPNGTHMLQPLDVAYFAPLKKAWRRILSEWKLTPEGRNQGTLTKKQYPPLLKKLIIVLDAQNGRENLKSGFRKCGLVPFDPSQVYDILPQTTESTLAPHQALDESLIDVLKELRGNSDPGSAGGSAAPKQKKVSKKDRLDLSPGRSVSIAELQPAQNAGSQSPVSSRQPKTSSKKMQSKGKAKGKGKKKVKNILLNTSPSSSKDDLQLMDYVIVEYEGSRFPGQINGIDFKDDKKVYKVSCMVKYKGGKGWIWPETPDIEEYMTEDSDCLIVSPIPTPKCISNRGIGRFEVAELVSIWGE